MTGKDFLEQVKTDALSWWYGEQLAHDLDNHIAPDEEVLGWGELADVDNDGDRHVFYAVVTKSALIAARVSGYDRGKAQHFGVYIESAPIRRLKSTRSLWEGRSDTSPRMTSEHKVVIEFDHAVFTKDVYPDEAQGPFTPTGMCLTVEHKTRAGLRRMMAAITRARS